MCQIKVQIGCYISNITQIFTNNNFVTIKDQGNNNYSTASFFTEMASMCWPFGLFHSTTTKLFDHTCMGVKNNGWFKFTKNAKLCVEEIIPNPCLLIKTICSTGNFNGQIEPTRTFWSNRVVKFITMMNNDGRSTHLLCLQVASGFYSQEKLTRIKSIVLMPITLQVREFSLKFTL